MQKIYFVPKKTKKMIGKSKCTRLNRRIHQRTMKLFKMSIAHHYIIIDFICNNVNYENNDDRR